ncbi:MAG: ribbon-helix-helix domain-containing protein [Thermoplasmata archaeon]|nr:ribbon-helix-helix domain-containing protein [Thermoplasmata archaeon]
MGESADRFLGVRLTAEELARLDRFGTSLDLPNRSEAVRALVRASDAVAAERDELPVGLSDQIETVVEDGWAPSRDAAVTLVLTLGLQELARIHAERFPSLRERAREAAERRRNRRKADRAGRGLLER